MLKGRTAHDLMRDYPETADIYSVTGERNLWSKGYWVSTAGLVKVDRVRAYISKGREGITSRKRHEPRQGNIGPLKYRARQ